MSIGFGGSGGGGGGGSVAGGTVVGNAGGDITVNSATFVDITNMSTTIAAEAGDKLLLLFSGHVLTASGALQLTFMAEGADVQSTTPLQTVSADNNSRQFQIGYLHTVAAGGTITVKARGRHLTAAQSIRNGANGVPVLVVVNLGS